MKKIFKISFVIDCSKEEEVDIKFLKECVKDEFKWWGKVKDITIKGVKNANRKLKKNHN